MSPDCIFRLASLAALRLSMAGLVQAQTPAPGVLTADVACLANPRQSYAIYVPSTYTPDRGWPILYCFDPMARGQVPVERFKDAAERYGYIVVGSNNSRNGPWPAIADAANAVVQDTSERFHLEERRCYTAGFSGGARAACVIAGDLGSPAVIACGGSFPGSVVPEKVPFAFFGTAGTEDFNYQELERVRVALDERRLPHRVLVFDGAHEWLPPELALAAIEWLEVHAMRTGSRPRDEAWLRAQFATRLRAAETLTDARATFIALRVVISDFEGLLDTTAASNQVAALEKSKKLRKAQQLEKQAGQQEDRWIEEIAEAIATARLGRTRRDSRDIARDLRQMSGSSAGGSERNDPFRAPGDGTMPNADRPPPLSLGDAREPPDADRHAPFREVIDRIRRSSARNIVARRVLHSAFSDVFERGRTRLLEGDTAEAAELLAFATLIEPTHARAHFELACAHLLKGDKIAARHDLQIALAQGFDNRQRIQQLHLALASENTEAEELEPFFFSEAPALLTSFGIALQLFAHPETHHLQRVIVHEVAVNSEAAGKGLGPGAEIRAIEGRNIRSFLAQFGPRSEFGRLLMRRRAGERIVLEVVAAGGGEVRTVVLTQGLDVNSNGLPWEVPATY